MTTLGGIFHTLPFLISDVHKALIVAGCVVAVELFAIAWVRKRFLHVSMRSSLLVVTVGGVIVLAIGVAIGAVLRAAMRQRERRCRSRPPRWRGASSATRAAKPRSKVAICARSMP